MKVFVAVQHPSAVFADGGHARPAPRPKPEPGSVSPPRADKFSAGQFWECICAFCASVPARKNVVRTERIVGRDDNAHRAIHAGKFFDGHHILDIPEARRRRIPWGRSSPARPSCPALSPPLERELGSLVPLHDMGADFTLPQIRGLISESCSCSSLS